MPFSAAPSLCFNAGADVNVRNKADLDGVCASIEWLNDIFFHIYTYIYIYGQVNIYIYMIRCFFLHGSK